MRFLSPELELFFPAAPAGSLTVVTVTQKTLGMEGVDLDLEKQQLLDKVRQAFMNVASFVNSAAETDCDIGKTESLLSLASHMDGICHECCCQHLQIHVD